MFDINKKIVLLFSLFNRYSRNNLINHITDIQFKKSKRFILKESCSDLNMSYNAINYI